MTERPDDTARFEGPRGDAARDGDDALLAPFFAAARAELTDTAQAASGHAQGGLPDALRARLLRDALTHIPAPRPVRPRPGLFARLLAAVPFRQLGGVLGGASGVAVVCSAGVAGVWIGLTVPGPASDLLGYVASGALVVSDDGSIWAQTARDISDDEALLALFDSF